MSGRTGGRQASGGGRRAGAASTATRDTWAIVRQVLTLVLLAVLALTGIATFALQSSDPVPTILGSALVLSALVALVAVVALVVGRLVRGRGR